MRTVHAVTWTPFDEEMRQAMLRPAAGPVHYDGSEVESFEDEVAGYLGARGAVAASSGTAALHLALLASGVGPGVEVIMPANAYVAIPESVIHVGARPVYCEVDGATGNIDAAKLRDCISARTRAVVVIHMYGNAAEMDALGEVCRENALLLVEDVAHALGGEYRGEKLGTLGDVGFTSFARKVIHVAGQGGMAFTNDPDVAVRMRQLRKHGWVRDDAYRERVAAIGFNYSFSECLAAVGRVNLRRIERYWAARNENAGRYLEAIASLNLPLRTFTKTSNSRHGRLHFVVLTPHRDRLHAFLAERGVETKIHYKTPTYRQPLYRTAARVDPEAYPVADRLASEVLTLPSHPDLGEGLDQIVGALKLFFDRHVSAQDPSPTSLRRSSE